MLLHSKTDYSVQVTLACEQADALCGIFHEPTHEVVLDNIPNGITRDNVLFTTLCLPCKHVFNTGALLRHFAICDMRCPICRGGDSAKLDCTKLPADFASKLHSEQLLNIKQQQEEQSMPITQDLIFNEQAWLRGYWVVLSIQRETQNGYSLRSISRAVFSSPLILHQLAENETVVFNLQQSMRRNVQAFILSNSSNVEDVTMTLQLQHQASDDVFAQLKVSQNVWQRIALNSHPTRQVNTGLQLKHGNIVVGNVTHDCVPGTHWVQNMQIVLNRDIIRNIALSYVIASLQQHNLFPMIPDITFQDNTYDAQHYDPQSDFWHSF